MEKSVLWQCLSALSNHERKRLGQWIESPFFCRNPLLIQFYRFLLQSAAQNRAPETEAVMAALNMDSITQFRLLSSELLGQIEHFLVYQEAFSQPEQFPVQLAAAFRKRSLPKHFNRALHLARQSWGKQPYRHSDFFEAQAAIEYEAYQFQSSTQRTEAFNLQELFDATDIAFIARKLRQACFGVSHQAVFKIEYDNGLLPSIIRHVEQKTEMLQQPAVALYYYCYLFLTEPDREDHFRRFKPMLIEKANALPPDMRRDLHLLAINYCIRKINQQQGAWYREAFDLYLSTLPSGLLLENGLLSPFAYNNIVAIALKVGESGWAQIFVNDYARFLDKKHREANMQLNLARVAYAQKQYRSAMLHLQSADYKDTINNLIAKTILMKIYFETDEWDALDAHLQSMQGFLRRQRIIGYHHDNYRNIIRFTRKIMQRNATDRNETTALRAQIEQTNPLSEKEWLLDMIK